MSESQPPEGFMVADPLKRAAEIDRYLDTPQDHLRCWYCDCAWELAAGGKYQPADNLRCEDCGKTRDQYEDFYRANQDCSGWRPKLK